MCRSTRATWISFLSTYDLTAADRDPDLADRIMQRLCEELSVDCLELLPEFRASGIAGYVPNGHLNVEGHALVARSVLGSSRAAWSRADDARSTARGTPRS